jgi:hypothetical protein
LYNLNLTNILYHCIYVCFFLCTLHPLHQITKMHNDIYIWSLWYALHQMHRE